MCQRCHALPPNCIKSVPTEQRRGCPNCRVCVKFEEPKCPKLMCPAVFCENPEPMTDESGCPACPVCPPTTPPPPPCPICGPLPENCIKSHIVEIVPGCDGCEVCDKECLPPSCSDVVCENPEPMTDENGCLTCPVCPPPPPPPPCPEPECEELPSNCTRTHIEKDSLGCPKCKVCVEEPECPKPDCPAIDCDNPEKKRDRNGCLFCPECPRCPLLIDCPVPSCNEPKRMIDEDGCERCPECNHE